MTRLRWIVVGLFALCHVAIPAVFIELYPFSGAPIFTRTVSTITVYDLFDPANQRVPPATFELALNYFGTFPETGLGKQKPHTINLPDRRLERAELERQIRRIAKEKQLDYAYLTIKERVLGAVDADTVGWISNASWRIDLR